MAFPLEINPYDLKDLFDALALSQKDFGRYGAPLLIAIAVGMVSGFAISWIIQLIAKKESPGLHILGIVVGLIVGYHIGALSTPAPTFEQRCMPSITDSSLCENGDLAPSG